MTDVTFKRLDYIAALPDWVLGDDVVSGDRAVKSKGETYLPDPANVEDSQKSKTYEKYKDRALFYNVTAHTLSSLIGTAFKKGPMVTVPESIGFVIDDIDGSGLSLNQQAQAVLGNVLVKGRNGLLVDYPDVATPTSMANSDTIRASILSINASQIINWRTTRYGGVHKLSLVVIEESYDHNDEFSTEIKAQYRVLRLTDGIYSVEIYRKTSEGFELYESYQPKNGAGSSWEAIPFTFVGAENNDHRIDKAPLLEMSLLNIKHYQVGADWYNSLHWIGKPQPTMTGLTEEWRDYLEEKGIVLGSNEVLPLPVNGDYKIVTISSDIALPTEITAIEDRMVAFNAKILQKGGAVKTATQAQNENETEHSILSLAAKNVSDAYSVALGWLAQFQKVSGDVSYELNTDYGDNTADAQMITALNGLGMSGQYPQSDLWSQLRKIGLIDKDKTDEDIKDELEASGEGLDLDEPTS